MHRDVSRKIRSATILLLASMALAASTACGGGSTGDASGSVVGNKIVLTGNSRFHYDESLRNAQTGAGYSVVAWQELRKVSGGWQP